MRLRDKRLWVLARAAGWSATNLAARLQIDVRSLRALRPDWDILPGDVLEVICDIFGITEDEYCHFSPFLPAEHAPHCAFVRSRNEGLARARAAVVVREDSRNVDRLARVVIGCASAHRKNHSAEERPLPGPNATLRSQLQWVRRERKMKLLAKVDIELSRANLPEWQARRYRMHFEGLANMLSFIGLVRVVRNLKHVQFFESVNSLNKHLCEQGLKSETDERSLGMWVPRSATLFLADGSKPRCLIGSEQAIYAHEIVHVLDHNPRVKRFLISDSMGWRRAWEAEIDCHGAPLTGYARKSACEGFAEFGALALTEPVLARRAFPKCWAVWRENCLDSDDIAALERPTRVTAQPLSTSDATPFDCSDRG